MFLAVMLAGGTPVASGQSITSNTPCLGGVCIGDKVIDIEDNVGIVEAIFGNGKAQVYYNLGWDAGLVKVKDINELTRSVSGNCLGNICLRDKVVDKENKIGTVIALFLNGKAQVYYNLGWDAALVKVRDIRELTK